MKTSTKVAVVLASAVADRALKAGERLLGRKPKAPQPVAPDDGVICEELMRAGSDSVAIAKVLNNTRGDDYPRTCRRAIAMAMQELRGKLPLLENRLQLANNEERTLSEILREVDWAAVDLSWVWHAGPKDHIEYMWFSNQIRFRKCQGEERTAVVADHKEAWDRVWKIRGEIDHVHAQLKKLELAKASV